MLPCCNNYPNHSLRKSAGLCGNTCASVQTAVSSVPYLCRYSNYYWIDQTGLVNRINSYFADLVERHNAIMQGINIEHFWSSSELSGTKARGWNVAANDNVYCFLRIKNFGHHVRPVLAF